jgi:Mn2+/Fe2+ NRAMP family transporter
VYYVLPILVIVGATITGVQSYLNTRIAHDFTEAQAVTIEKLKRILHKVVVVGVVVTVMAAVAAGVADSRKDSRAEEERRESRRERSRLYCSH